MHSPFGRGAGRGHGGLGSVWAICQLEHDGQCVESMVSRWVACEVETVNALGLISCRAASRSRASVPMTRASSA